MKCEDCGDEVSSDCYCQIVPDWDKYIHGFRGEDGPVVTTQGSYGPFNSEQTLKNLAEMGQEYDAYDNVNSPSHYNQSGIECIDAIKASLGDNYQDYCKGNVMKYLWRYKYKNGIEDLKKAQWYLNSMIESMEDQ
jgi:hypothetical protein